MNSEQFKREFAEFMKYHSVPEKYLEIFKRKLQIVVKDFGMDKLPSLGPEGPGYLGSEDGKVKVGAVRWNCIIPKEFVKNSDQLDNIKDDQFITIDSSEFSDAWKELEKKYFVK